MVRFYRKTLGAATKKWLLLLPGVGILLQNASCTEKSVAPVHTEGKSAITVSVPNTGGGITEANLTFSTNAPVSARTFVPYEYQPALEETDLAVVWSLQEAPDGMTIEESGGLIRWTPEEQDGGSEVNFSVVATTIDASSMTGVQEATVTVAAEWWKCAPSETLPDFEFLSPETGDTFYVGDTMHLQICVRNEDVSLDQASIAFSPDLGVSEKIIQNTHSSDDYFIDHHWIWVITETVGDVFNSISTVGDKCVLKVWQYSVPENSANSGVFTIAKRSNSVSARRRTLVLQ